MVHQHFMLVPVLTVAENIILGEETMANPVFLDRRRPTTRSSSSAGGSASRSTRHQGRLPVGRLAAAGRDPQGALPRRQDPRPRRAHRRPDATGDGGDLRGPAPPRGRGPQHRLHQPQAVRGPRDRGPDHRHPARQGRRPADPVRDERGGPRRADGRSRGVADGRSRRVAPGARPQRRGPASSSDDRGPEVVHGIDLEVRAGEILGIAGVAGNGQDELVEALVGLRKPAGGKVTLDGKDITDQPARRLRGGRRIRPGRPPPLRAGPALHDRRQPRPDELLPPPYARGILRNDAAIQATADERIKEFDIRTPSADVAAGDAVGRQPAEGRRRPRVRARPAPARPRPADARARCRQHRVHPPPGDRQARRRDGDPAGLRRARRDPRAVRPDRGHLPRQAGRPWSTGGRRTRTRSAC